MDSIETTGCPKTTDCNFKSPAVLQDERLSLLKTPAGSLSEKHPDMDLSKDLIEIGFNPQVFPDMMHTSTTITNAAKNSEPRDSFFLGEFESGICQQAKRLHMSRSFKRYYKVIKQDVLEEKLEIKQQLDCSKNDEEENKVQLNKHDTKKIDNKINEYQEKKKLKNTSKKLKEKKEDMKKKEPKQKDKLKKAKVFSTVTKRKVTDDVTENAKSLKGKCSIQ